MSTHIPQFNADRGEMDFAYRLGKIYYQGSTYGAPGGAACGGDGASIVPRDFHRARYYFRIARQVWPRDPPTPGNRTVHPRKTSPFKLDTLPWQLGTSDGCTSVARE